VLLFDAQRGAWPGSGFFTSFDPGTLVVASPPTIDNAYLSTDTIAVTDSISAGQRCEYFPEVGQTICTGGDSSQNVITREHYKADIGPVGFFYSNTFSFCGGGFCSGGSSKRNVGLVASSLRGDVAADRLEIEPNDAAATTQPLDRGSPVVGSIRRTDPGTFHAQVQTSPVNTDGIIADWYKFTLPPATGGRVIPVVVQINLQIQLAGTDVDLYLFNDSVQWLRDSLRDNIGTGDMTDRFALS
jgi:hypothetical protein